MFARWYLKCHTQKIFEHESLTNEFFFYKKKKHSCEILKKCVCLFLRKKFTDF